MITNIEDYLKEKRLFHNALVFAAKAHKDQLRKGTDIPYIIHPFETAEILIDANAHIFTVCAGLLHDTVEDTDIALPEIKALFGDAVEKLVAFSTEDKSKSWKERKQHTLLKLKMTPSLDEILLVCADKLSNLRSLAAEYQVEGDKMWERFNAGFEEQAWFFGSLIDVFKPLVDYDMFWEFLNLYKEAFVMYFRANDRDELLQTDGTRHFSLSRAIPKWIPLAALDWPHFNRVTTLGKDYRPAMTKEERFQNLEGYTPISKLQAHTLERQWQRELMRALNLNIEEPNEKPKYN